MLEYKNNSDLELLLLLKQGEQLAFAELFQRYHQPLYFHAKKMLRDMDEAKDIVQDVFATIWSKRDHLTIPAAVDAYLYGAVRNRILNVIAHQNVVSKYAESIDRFLAKGGSYTDEQLREKELARIIEQEISLLPEKMREVFEMSRNDELSYREIADKLNISENTVKKQAQRAIKILKLRIKLNLFLATLPF